MPVTGKLSSTFIDKSCESKASNFMIIKRKAQRTQETGKGIEWYAILYDIGWYNAHSP